MSSPPHSDPPGTVPASPDPEGQNPGWSPASAGSFPILVAIAADECTTASVRVAEALAAEEGATPVLLYVMELTPLATLDGGIGAEIMVQTLLEPKAQERDKKALRAECGVDTGRPAEWPFEIDVGDPALSIVTLARQIHAKLIVMGVRHHSAAGRVLGRNTMHNVMRLSGIPVLAVRPGLEGRPRSIVVAVDFSQASLRAAQLAREIMASDGTMHLVFVASSLADTISESQEGQRLIEAHGVESAFEEMRTRLRPTPGMTIAAMTRRGVPVDALKAVCEEIGPDLVAIGSQRHPFLDRFLLGSVAESIANDGRWPVLVTPPASRSEAEAP